MPQPSDTRAETGGNLHTLASAVVACTLCPRLVEYRCRVAEGKVRGFKGEEYWGRPVPGFGDPDARLLVLGLAPAAHGGNRTGRVFTGDGTSRFLMKALYEGGFANQPTSEHRDDGLVLRGVYLTAAVKCAPPENRPTSEEVVNCSRYLREELRMLPSLKVVLTLGRLAFDAYASCLAEVCKVDTRALKFRHGTIYRFEQGLPILFVSYHPSPRNTQTGLLSADSFKRIIAEIRRALG